MGKKGVIISVLMMVLLVSFLASESYSQTQASKKTISWRLRTYTSGVTSTEVIMAREFAKKMHERTKGRLEIKVLEAGTLGYSGFEIHKVVGDRLLEMAIAMAGGIGTEMPAFAVSELPFMFSDWKPEWNKIAPRLAVEEAEPILQEMAGKMKLVYFNYQHLPDALPGKKKVAKVEDWKGLKLRSWSPYIAATGKALGASTITVPYADMYTAFATNIIEANCGETKAVLDMKLHEVLKFVNLWPVDSAHAVIVVNQAAWKELDKDLQNILAQSLKELSHAAYEAYWTGEWKAQQEAEKMGVQIVKVAPEEIAKARAIVKKAVWEPWLNQSGDTGKKLFDIMMKYETIK